MPEILDDIAYLSQEIGPRPAGTEEEQQAALYITEQLQKRAGLPTEIEDFSCNSQADIVKLICFGVPLILAIGAFIRSMLVIPAFFVALIGAVLFAMEAFGKPVLSKLFERGVSQNVVAKYTPGGAGATKRARKIVLVANYDSGKVQNELNGGLMGIYPILQKVCLYALIALPVLLLVRGLFLLNATGAGALVLRVITIIDLVLIAIPVVMFFVHRAATYNEAANSNGAGVAVLLETARRVAAGRMSPEELAAQEVQIHGEEAAREAGLVPEQAQIEYETRVSQALDEPETEMDRLAAAKAAVAALTGQPVREYAPAPTDISGRLVQVRESSPSKPDAEAIDEQRKENIAAFTGASALPEDGYAQTAQQPESAPSMQNEAPQMQQAAQPHRAVETVGTPVPDWFKTAQEKANKPRLQTPAPVKRSRYADALDAAVAMSSQHFEQANKVIDKETEERLQKMREGIVEVKAPTVEAVERQAADQGTRPMQPVAQQAEPAPQPREAVPQAEQAAPQAYEPAYAPAKAPVAAPAPTPEPVQPQPAPAPVQQQPVAAPPVQPAEQGMGATSSMPPLDVSDLRAAVAASRQEAARALQGRPSQHVEAAPRRDVDRVVYNETDLSAQEAALEQARQVNTAPARRDFAQIPQPEQAAEEQYPALQRQQPAPLQDQAAAPVVLPDVANSTLPPIGDLAKQRAPLAEAEEDQPAQQPANPLLSGRIPRINLDALPAEEAQAIAAMPDNKRAALRNSLPSMSGSIHMEPPAVKEPEVSGAVSLTGSFAPVAATGTIKPVGDELVADMDPSEMYVEDADDSSYDVETTETGAFAGPGYMDMPKKKHGLFGRFRKGKKNKQEEVPSTQDWLNVDENFTATEVGAARGGWESFREDSAYERDEREQFDDYADDGYVDDGYVDDEFADDGYIDDFYEDEEDSDWKGGAFSKIRSKVGRGAGDDDYDAGGYDDFGEAAEGGAGDDFGDAEAQSAPVRTRAPRKDAQAGRPERAPRAGREDVGEAAPRQSSAAHDNVVDVSGEIKRIYEFRNPDVDVEVWFVALGSELSGNGGTKAFLREHGQELRGSIIVNLESLGAGKLSYIESEGAYVSKSPSSRMKRYLKKASQASGVSASSAKIEWRDSAASLAMKHGLQAMSIIGMDGPKPAMLGQGDDVLESIDTEMLEASADFVMGIIKNA